MKVSNQIILCLTKLALFQVDKMAFRLDVTINLDFFDKIVFTVIQ